MISLCPSSGFSSALQSFFFFFGKSVTSKCENKVSFWLLNGIAYFFIIYKQKEKPSVMVTNILFFLNFYNSRYDVLFLLIRRNPLLLTYLLETYRLTKSIQEIGSRWMSIERKSFWTVHVTNKYFVYCFSLRWYVNSWNDHCIWN